MPLYLRNIIVIPHGKICFCCHCLCLPNYFPVKNESSNKMDRPPKDKRWFFQWYFRVHKTSEIIFFDHVKKTWYDEAVIAEDHGRVGRTVFLNIPQQELLQKKNLG